MLERKELIEEYFQKRNEHFGLCNATPSSWKGKGEDVERDKAISNFIVTNIYYSYCCYPVGSDDNIMICLKGIDLDENIDSQVIFGGDVEDICMIPYEFDLVDIRLLARLVPIRELHLNRVQYLMIDDYIPDIWKHVGDEYSFVLDRSLTDTRHFYSFNPHNLGVAKQINLLNADCLKSSLMFRYDSAKSDLVATDINIFEVISCAIAEIPEELIYGDELFDEVECEFNYDIDFCDVDFLDRFNIQTNERQALIDYYLENSTEEAISRQIALGIYNPDGLELDVEFAEHGPRKIVYKYDKEHDWLILVDMLNQGREIRVPDVFDVCQVFFDEKVNFIDLGQVSYLMHSEKVEGYESFACKNLKTLIGRNLKFTCLLDLDGTFFEDLGGIDLIHCHNRDDILHYIRSYRPIENTRVYLPSLQLHLYSNASHDNFDYMEEKYVDEDYFGEELSENLYVIYSALGISSWSRYVEFYCYEI